MQVCRATKGGDQAGRCQGDLFLLAAACNGETSLSWSEKTGATSRRLRGLQDMLAVPNYPIGGLANRRVRRKLDFGFLYGRRKKVHRRAPHSPDFRVAAGTGRPGGLGQASSLLVSAHQSGGPTSLVRCFSYSTRGCFHFSRRGEAEMRRHAGTAQIH